MSQRTVRFSLQWKFVILVLLFILVVSGIPSLYLLDYAQRKQIEEIDKRAAVILDNINHVASDAIVQDDLLALNDTVLKYLTDTEIRSIAIYDSENRILYYSDGELVVNQDSALTNGQAREFLIDSPFAKQALASNRVVFKNFRFWHTALVPVKQVYVSATTRGPVSLIFEYSSPIHHPTPSIYRQLGTIRMAFDTRKIDQSLQETRTRIFLIIGALLLLSVTGTFLLSRYITTPIRRLARDVQVIGSGDLEHRILVDRNDEIGLLSGEFDEMTRRLGAAQRDLLAKKLLERDMQLAAEIQTSLLPKDFLKRGKVEYFGISVPAKGVGGDYFDVIAFDDRLDGVVISDVSGKGLPAALLMVMLKTIFHVVAESEIRSPKLICEIANRFLAKNVSRDKFATVQFAVLDHHTGILRFTNSGHGKFHIFREATGEFEDHMVAGIPIGMLTESKYAEIELKLLPGDIAVLFTDGIPEARNKARQTYGEKRMTDLIRSKRGADAREMTEAILADVRAFMGEALPYDDMTVLTVRLPPSQGIIKDSP